MIEFREESIFFFGGENRNLRLKVRNFQYEIYCSSSLGMGKKKKRIVF